MMTPPVTPFFYYVSEPCNLNHFFGCTPGWKTTLVYPGSWISRQGASIDENKAALEPIKRALQGSLLIEEA